MTIRRFFTAVHGTINPYDAVNTAQIPEDKKGWGSEDPALKDVINIVRPKLILEIGTWKGASALFMAACAKESGMKDIEIVCADPHVGSAGLWLHNKPAMHSTDKGECGTYDIFLANVIRANMTDLITPFRSTATIASSIMEELGIKPDLVYIDGSHDEIDVRNDLSHTQKISHQDTVIICDDYQHPRLHGVTKAVSSFLNIHQEFKLTAAPATPRSTYTEKINDDETGKKAILVHRQSRFLRPLQSIL